MGRPKKTNPRDCQLNIRFTADEKKLVVTHAVAQGEEPVEHGRRVLLETAGSAPALSLPSRFDQLVEIQLRRLGNLLNQLVRHLHMTGELLPDAAPLLEEIRTLLRRTMP